MIIPKELLDVAVRVANSHGLNLDDLRDRCRNRAVVEIRREAATALRAAGASWVECGAILKRDRASVMNLVKGKAWKAGLARTEYVRPACTKHIRMAV